METGGRIEARKFASFVKPDDEVVDFGCGGGYTLKSLVCRRRIGIEINPAAQEAAIANGVECYPDLLRLADDSADVVISNHALEHVPSPIQALKEIRRVLKAGGVLVLIVPIDDWRTQTAYDAADINHHLFTWTPQLMGNCLVEAGYEPASFTIKVLTHAWVPGALRAFPMLPASLFDAGCRLFSMITHRRQLVVVARNRPAE
jgi:SAM-dependent methyltransferase